MVSFQLQIATIHIHLAAILSIAMYYIMSIFSIQANVAPETKSIFKKSSGTDYFVTALILIAPLILLIVLLVWSSFITLTLIDLLLFYLYFLFFFTFIYCESNWHRPGAIIGIDKDDWWAEIRYFVLSIQTQTTLGYTRTRPNDLTTEIASSIQTLIGVFFVSVIIAKAVGQLATG